MDFLFDDTEHTLSLRVSRAPHDGLGCMPDKYIDSIVLHCSGLPVRLGVCKATMVHACVVSRHTANSTQAVPVLQLPLALVCLLFAIAVKANVQAK